MNASRGYNISRAVCLSAVLLASAAYPHSASDAYLTIKTDANRSSYHAQWDVALRDLEFVLALDGNGDGKLTWGELNGRKEEVAKYAYSHIRFSAAGQPCSVKAQAFEVDEHADGAYVALFFDVRCSNDAASLPTLDYSLFFDIDPSHRCILVLQNGDAVSTALIAPETGSLKLAL